MNATNTLHYLNTLFKTSRPIVLHASGYIEGPVPSSLWDNMEKIEESCTDEATRQEIISAAKEKRLASDCYITWATSHHAGSMIKGIPWQDTARRWEIAKPQIQALIDSYNTKTLSAYETYRIACEQGVAVPPQ
jgi:hypothetical protein